MNHLTDLPQIFIGELKETTKPQKGSELVKLWVKKVNLMWKLWFQVVVKGCLYQGYNARKVNCSCVFSAYKLKPVLPGRNL